MKTKSFGEFVLDVWAVVIRTVAPSYCVKYLTLKTRSDAERYLPGKAKELELICKLELSNEEIAARVWSHQTKLALINRECEALLGEVKTEEEFNAVIALSNARMLIKTARVYTPSRAKMKELCSSLAPCTLKALAKEVPAAFDALTAAEVLGTKEDELIPATYERWGVATILAKAKPSWTSVFLKKLREITPHQLGEEGHGLIGLFFNIAFTAKVDMSEMMPYFCVFRPELYAKVRENLFSYEEVSPYFCMIFPQLLQYLHKDISYDSIYGINLKGELKLEEDAYAWLRIGYERLYEPKVFSCFVTNLQQIKEHILSTLYLQLFRQMVAKAPDYSALVLLYRLADDVLETEIPWKLVAGMEKKKLGATLRFAFPFKGWNEKLTVRAIEAMVTKNEFPVERVSELFPEMQKVAINAMETQSQIAAIDKGDVAELVRTVLLHPKAERHLLAQSGMEKYQATYLQRFRIDDTTFTWILDTLNLSMATKERFLFMYAEHRGLSENQYLQIMQSHFAKDAPFLKKFVQSEQ